MTNEELILEYRKTKDEKYINELLKINRQLAVYACRNVQMSEREDCIQVCLTEMWKAALMHDPTKSKFSTFAVSRLKWAVWNFIKKIPRNQVQFFDNSSYWPRFGGESDLKAYLDFLPEYQSKLIMEYLMNGKLANKSQRTSKSAGIKKLAALVDQI